MVQTIEKQNIKNYINNICILCISFNWSFILTESKLWLSCTETWEYLLASTVIILPRFNLLLLGEIMSVWSMESFLRFANPKSSCFWWPDHCDPSGVYSPKTTQNSQLKNLGQNGQKSKNGLKSYFLLIDCLETWSDCSLQLSCVLKAVKPRKRVW